LIPNVKVKARMIDDLPLRWLVTGLFLLSGAGYAMVTDRRSWTSLLSHGLHLTMAVAMAAMAWPRGLRLPTTPAEVFFLAAALWFVMTAIVAARKIAQRVVRGYHALTMLAMSWMYAAMSGHLPSGRLDSDQRAPPGMSMPDMDMTAMDMPADDTYPGWVDTGNWVWTAIFVLAALCWGYRFVAQRPRARSRRRKLVSAVQMTMAAGMAIMFGSMLFQD
jgi:hypothetical protein